MSDYFLKVSRVRSLSGISKKTRQSLDWVYFLLTISFVNYAYGEPLVESPGASMALVGLDLISFDANTIDVEVTLSSTLTAEQGTSGQGTTEEEIEDKPNDTTDNTFRSRAFMDANELFPPAYFSEEVRSGISNLLDNLAAQGPISLSDIIAGLKDIAGLSAEDISEITLIFQEEAAAEEGENFVTFFTRGAPSAFGDGISTPAGEGRPSAREVSNALFAQTGDEPNSSGASAFFWLWGQFMDHDLDLVEEGGPSFNIPVPLGDPFFDPFFTGTQEIHLERTPFADGTGPGTGVPGEHLNEVTSIMDASQVYGSDPARIAALRDPVNPGKLDVSAMDFLPFNTQGFPNAMGTSPMFFFAGDVRANENILLTSMHNLFVREHNRLVDEFAKVNPDWDSDQLYNAARAIVEGEIQAITYDNFLHLLLGPTALNPFAGTVLGTDVTIAHEFAGAAFRLGHSLLNPDILRLEEDGSTFAGGNLLLREAFFNPATFITTGPDVIFRGAGEAQAQELDLHIIDDVRNFLFGPPGAGGFDLGSLNVQRGRDLGFPDYNTVRTNFGLDPVAMFSDITADVGVQTALMGLYGDVNNIDLFAGGLAEDPIPGSMLGELFYTIVSDQYVRLRDGDPDHYLNSLGIDQIALVKELTLSDVIRLNTGVEYIQDNPLISYDRQGGDAGGDILHGGGSRDLLIGFGGSDILDGMGGADHLFGGEGADMLLGGVGTDILVGGPGPDILIGGGGADTYRFSITEIAPGVWRLEDAATDTVSGFSGPGMGGDLLEFVAPFDFNGSPDLDPIVTLDQVGPNLNVEFNGGGMVTLTDVSGVIDIDDISTASIV